MSQVLKIVRGVPGSGKTTYAKKWVNEDPVNRVRVNRDDLRLSLFNSYVLDPSQEAIITKAEHSLIKTLLTAKKSVIVDNVNVKLKYVAEYLSIAARLNVPVVHKDFIIDIDEALKRNASRDRVVPEKYIRTLYSRYVQNGKFVAFPDYPVTIPYEGDETLPKAILLDVDGTAMLKHPGRGYFDWDKVIDDIPNVPVIETVKALADKGYLIVVLSGREDVGNCKEDTVTSLEVAGIPVHEIHLREAGDHRKDNLVKRDIFETYIRNRYNILVALDDRQQVVDMYREEVGLPVFQVNYGDF